MNAPTTFAPSAMGASVLGVNALAPAAQASALAPTSSAATGPGGATLELPANFPVPLTSEQASEIRHAVDQFSFRKLQMRDIPQMGMHSEVELRRALDGFLSRIDKQNNPQLFKLTNELTERFEDAKLEQVADRILTAQPSWFMRLYGKVNPRALRHSANRIYEDVQRQATGTSKTLSDHVNGIEQKLVVEMDKLRGELTQMDAVKEAYRAGLFSFAVDVAMLHNALLKARVEFAAWEPELQADQQLLKEAKDKLQALESRALAVESTMTRLPSDQDTIRELQNAGVGTLQELATTMTSRFSSIKMELLTIHGALAVQGVQRLGEQGAALDANLGKVRGKLMKNVVATAATAPGRNREAQAAKVLAIVQQNKELQQLAEQARGENALKFNAARATLAQARQEMGLLGNASTSLLNHN